MRETRPVGNGPYSPFSKRSQEFSRATCPTADVLAGIDASNGTGWSTMTISTAPRATYSADTLPRDRHWSGPTRRRSVNELSSCGKNIAASPCVNSIFVTVRRFDTWLVITRFVPPPGGVDNCRRSMVSLASRLPSSVMLHKSASSGLMVAVPKAYHALCTTRHAGLLKTSPMGIS